MDDISDAEFLEPTLRLVLDTAMDAAVVMNEDGRVTGWSRRAEVTFGWTKAEAIGRSMAELIIPEQHRVAHERGLRRYIASGQAHVLGRRIEITAIGKDGEEFPVELSINDIHSSLGLHFVGFLRDIRERKQNEHRLRRQAEEASLVHRLTTMAAGPASFDEILRECLASVCKLMEWPLGHAFIPSGSEPRRLVATNIWYAAEEAFEEFQVATGSYAFARGEGLPGDAWAKATPVWIEDVGDEARFPRLAAAHRNGIRSAFAFPLFVSGELVAVAEFFTKTPATPDEGTIKFVQSVAEQVGRVLERKRSEESLRNEVARRTQVEEHQKLLLHEMDHRVKNMLTVVMGIARQTGRNSASLEQFLTSYEARLSAMAGGYDLLVRGGWKTASLDEVVDTIVSPHIGMPEQLSTAGPAVALAPKAAIAFAMIFHELTTNAAKYGALSVPHGSIRVEWSNPTPTQLTLIWSEVGCPLREPLKAGFGTRLVQAMAKGDLGGQAELHPQPDGIRYIVNATLDH
ncbi:MAG: PAS domain S-box protein [Beijerinckiaceae bacterium]|nr:PAS domain S-box protein [Beijerinckiaceae bacterium]